MFGSWYRLSSWATFGFDPKIVGDQFTSEKLVEVFLRQLQETYEQMDSVVLSLEKRRETLAKAGNAKAVMEIAKTLRQVIKIRDHADNRLEYACRLAIKVDLLEPVFWTRYREMAEAAKEKKDAAMAAEEETN